MSVGTSKAQASERQFAAAPVYDSMQTGNPFLSELKELIRYRDLLWQLVSRNIKTRYKRSVLGIFWTMLNPLLMMLVLTFIFSNIFRFQLPHYATYALSGLALWNFFAQTTTGAMSELIWGSSLMHRIYLPRSIFAISALGTSLVNLVLTLIPLFVVMLITGTPLRPALLILPLPIILTAMFALGVALILSRVAAFFADVLEMYQILLMVWMYLTPIIYPKEIIPERLRWLFNLNPLYHLIEIFRAPLLVGWLAGPNTVLASVVAALATLAFGWWYFSRKADELAYRI
ncbi:MAG: ABC transporter permease [Acidobacteria bacterium]|nr:ABC transporter permease [Acidobacteriota bacterium]